VELGQLTADEAENTAQERAAASIGANPTSCRRLSRQTEARRLGLVCSTVLTNHVPPRPGKMLTREAALGGRSGRRLLNLVTLRGDDNATIVVVRLASRPFSEQMDDDNEICKALCG